MIIHNLTKIIELPWHCTRGLNIGILQQEVFGINWYLVDVG